MNFKNKYYKYKFKYLNLKKQTGGSKEIIDEINSKLDSGDFICLGHVTSLDNAFKILNHGYFVPAPMSENLQRPVSIKYKYPENEYDFDYYLYMFFTNHLGIKNHPDGRPITLENAKDIKKYYLNVSDIVKKYSNLDYINKEFNIWLRDRFSNTRNMPLYEDILTRYKRLAGSTALTKLWDQNPSGSDGQINAIWFAEIDKLRDNILEPVSGWHKKDPIKFFLLLPKSVAYTDYYYYVKKDKDKYLQDTKSMYGQSWTIPRTDIAKSKDEIKKKYNDFLNTRGRYKAEIKEENLCCHKVESKFFVPKSNELLTQFDVDTEFIKLVVVSKKYKAKMIDMMNKIEDNKFKNFKIVYV